MDKGELNPGSRLPERAKAQATLLSNLPDAAHECTPDAPWLVHYISDGVQSLTGHPPEAFTQGSLTWGDITHPDDFPALKILTDEAIAEGRRFSTSYRIICASGEEKWIFETGEPVASPSGQPSTVVGFISDVTQLKHTEEALKESEAHYRSAMELNGQLPWSAAGLGRVIDLSDKFLTNVGMTRQQALGDGWLKAVHPQDVDEVVRLWSEAVSSETPVDLRLRALHTSGKYSWYRVRGAPRRDADGRMVSWHGTSEIIDSQVEAETRLESAQAELVHLSQSTAMNVMAATLAHELNQPLAAASNYLAGSRTLLSEHGRPEDVKILHGLIEAEQQIHRAGEVIRKVRNLIRPNGVKQEKVAIAPLIRRVIQLVEASGACPALTVSVSVDKGANIVAVDHIQIEQVLVNLLRNACLAMSDTNAPIMAVSVTQDGENVRVTIEDNGGGFGDVPPEDLFNVQGHPRNEGLGLGLSISRTIVEAHGGRIWAEHNAEGGASFMFTVPTSIFDIQKSAVHPPP